MNSVKVARLLQFLVVSGCVACGGSSPNNPTPIATSTITLTAAGASPKNISVALGTRVLFINNDSRSHNMTSDPHPEHDECPEINQIGFLQPGEKRETGNLVIVRSCGFHDHDNPAATTLQGTIAIK